MAFGIDRFLGFAVEQRLSGDDIVQQSVPGRIYNELNNERTIHQSTNIKPNPALLVRENATIFDVKSLEGPATTVSFVH